MIFRLLIIAPILFFFGCSNQIVHKELTEQEKLEIRQQVETIKDNIVNPIIGIALSACQYHKSFEVWPNANFSSTHQSDFDNFKVLPSDSNFYSEFKLKASEFTFYLNMGVPGTKFNNNQISYQNNVQQTERDRMKKKVSDKLSKLLRDNNETQDNSKASGDCVFMLNASHPYNPANINLSGPIVLGKTWATDAERNQLASGFFFISSLSGTTPKKQDSNLLEKLLSNEITKAFIMVSLCSVLGVEPANCR